jgi:hypothetical protein
MGETTLTHKEPPPTFSLPAGLPVLRVRVTLRLLEDATLPVHKAAMLRGGFGYAFQRATCPQSCWGQSDQCATDTICPYRQVFETPRPPDSDRFRNLRDIPRPFVLEPPTDGKTRYAGGDSLELTLVLIGQGMDYVPYFLFGFEQLGRMGLGKQRARARLERVEALHPWQPMGRVIYRDGEVLTSAEPLPALTEEMVTARARTLPADLHLVLRTPLRVKARGEFLQQIDLAALVQAICWRIQALAAFHSSSPWEHDYRPLIAQAQEVVVAEEQVGWADWTRTSTRGSAAKKMTLGGLLGSAVLHNVSPDLRAVLLMGSLVHVGKACVFGHGGYALQRLE